MNFIAFNWFEASSLSCDPYLYEFNQHPHKNSVQFASFTILIKFYKIDKISIKCINTELIHV